MKSLPTTTEASAATPFRARSAVASPFQSKDIAAPRSHSFPPQPRLAIRDTIASMASTATSAAKESMGALVGAVGAVGVVSEKSSVHAMSPELEFVSVRKVEKSSEDKSAKNDVANSKKRASSPKEAPSKRRSIRTGEGSQVIIGAETNQNALLRSTPANNLSDQAVASTEQSRVSTCALQSLPTTDTSVTNTSTRNTLSTIASGLDDASSEARVDSSTAVDNSGSTTRVQGKPWSARTWTARQYHMMAREALNHFPFEKFMADYGKDRKEVSEVWSALISMPALEKGSREPGQPRGGLGEQKMKEYRTKEQAMLAVLKAEAAAEEEVLNQRKIEAYKKERMEEDKKKEKTKTTNKKPKTLAEALEQMEAANKESAKALKVYEKMKVKEEKKKSKATDETGEIGKAGGTSGGQKKKRATKTSAASKG